MRFGWILLILLFALFGILFGALNSENVVFDFYFFNLMLPKGAALLCALSLGWLLGGLLIYLGLVLKLRRQLRLAYREGDMTAARIDSRNTTDPALPSGDNASS